MTRSYLVLLSIVCLLGKAFGEVGCIGEDGKAVDWWLALKAPGTDRSGNTKYGYIDNKSEISDGAYIWREGTQISGNASNPPADTLAPIYTSDNLGYVIWNDEPGKTHCPEGCTSFVLGHSKGILAFDQSGGFWLSHSVPKYPDSPQDSKFTGIQVGQTLNGQSFTCISLNQQGINTAAKVLRVADLDIYSPHSLPSQFAKRYPDVMRLASTALDPYGPVEPKVQLADQKLTTRGGVSLRIFAKSSTGSDGESVRMWEDVVEAALHKPMLIQSWPEGRNKDLPSYCGKPKSDYASISVTKMTIPKIGLSWTTRTLGFYKDHSKWGITNLEISAPADQKAGIFCAGDNNRAIPQNFRGGTAICFIGVPALHRAVQQSVSGTEECEQYR